MTLPESKLDFSVIQPSYHTFWTILILLRLLNNICTEYYHVLIYDTVNYIEIYPYRTTDSMFLRYIGESSPDYTKLHHEKSS
jgi:hypothetical protein